LVCVECTVQSETLLGDA